MKKKIEEMNIGEIKNAKKELEEINNSLRELGVLEISQAHPFEIGENYFIRTVTMALMGKLIWVGNQELKLSEASWIADTGRFADFLNGKKINEVEPFPNEIIVGRGSIIDACIWKHKLLREQK
jgi:hypothetical protein